jgi:5'-nucleotidase
MRPLILVTNDDGLHSPGLLAAAESVSDLGDLLIAAPATQQTSMSRAFVTGDDIGAIARHDLRVAGRTVAAYSVVGSPVVAGNPRAAGTGGPDPGSMHQRHQLRRERRRRARS